MVEHYSVEKATNPADTNKKKTRKNKNNKNNMIKHLNLV